jgi:hypothetical protein
MKSFLLGVRIGALALVFMLSMAVAYANLPLWTWAVIIPAAVGLQRAGWHLADRRRRRGLRAGY